VDWFKEFGVERPHPDPVTGEVPVKPYAMTDANAGATPFSGDGMARTFGGQTGIHQLAERLVVLITTDPAIKTIFFATDKVRLQRTLYEQFCYILGAGCPYTGRDMREAHRQLGIRTRDMNALVADLQRAMRERGIPFAAQNRFLAKLAPMKRDVVTR
jgi:hemoglobin